MYSNSITMSSCNKEKRMIKRKTFGSETTMQAIIPTKTTTIIPEQT